MPINIPNELPAIDTLTRENIFFMTYDRAFSQDIRPLKLLIFNLMPTKIETETQLLRLLSNSPLQVDLDFLCTATYVGKNTPTAHLDKFYETFDAVKERTYDGMIITGAPVEHMPFDEVAYWSELTEIMTWSTTHVYSTLHICWGAQAALYYHYGIPKYPLPQKMFGVFPHYAYSPEPIPLLRGLDDIFYVPHTRHTEIRLDDLLAHKELTVLSLSVESGVFAIMAKNGRQIFLTGHVEYDIFTLKNEYERDRNKGLPIQIPDHYFPDNDPLQHPVMSWRSSAHLIFANWLNYYVYQETPYDLSELGN